MTLSELLQELRQNILFDRSDRIAGADDYLWSDATLIRYINQAQRRFARESMILRDNSDKYGLVNLTAGQSNYVLDEHVLAVISAKQGTDIADLARAGHSSFNTYFVPDPYFFDPSSLSSLPPGKPVAFGTDETLVARDSDKLQQLNLHVYPAPSADFLAPLHLRVCRFPEKLEDLDDECEIPEDHQLEMLDWAAYLALRVVDTDAGSPQRAAEFRASFEDHAKNAKREVMRKLFTPAQWGFGRNGYSWER